ncbi:hypothetical protein BS47DRAFT_1143041 [Hydnum rufescens UP504]|uniref:NADH dehydrogenase [ubiquinone] 1 alpha subcomplex subunit n=1 Tax=Hydnum rufescens UP504 TaxID=1448309 RepID=A0A9P6DUH6_9AGAM|nr:hypothetical protein BS47DRAFT_1143041 [Hydnum rufescens UP504]
MFGNRQESDRNVTLPQKSFRPLPRSAMNGFWSRWLARLRIGRHYVGRDLEGNRFYEYPPAQPNATRTKRVVVYRKQRDMWKYASGISRLPVQWTAWMSHTRLYPPSIEDLQNDMVRRSRVTQLAAQIETRDQEERHRQLVASSALGPTVQGLSESSAVRSDDPASNSSAPPPSGREKVEEGTASPFRQAKDASDEPETWSPKVLRRRG